MIRERTTKKTRSRGRNVSLHLADYVAILKNHKLAAFLALFVVVAAMGRNTLYKKPVYQAESTIQLQPRTPSGTALELLWAAKNSTTDAEMQIMRSNRVAAGAAEHLEANDFLVEENAYRPLDVLLRDFGIGKRPKCSVAVRVPLPKDSGDERALRFEFSAERGPTGTPRRLTVRRRNAPENETPVVIEDFAAGTPFDAFDHRFVLEVEGDAAGRRFHLDLWTRHRIALYVQGRVVVREIGARTGVIGLGCRTQNPLLAQRIASALAKSYERHRSTEKSKHLTNAVAFLRGQTDRLREQLRKAEFELDQFRIESGATLLSSRSRWIVTKIGELELGRAALDHRLREQQRLVDRLDDPGGLDEAMLALGGTESDPMTESLAQRLSDLQVKRSLLALEDTTPEHPAQKRLHAEIEASRKKLRGNLHTLLGRHVSAAETALLSTAQAIARYEEEMKQLPQTERRLTELSREVEAYLQTYRFLQEKQQEAEIAMASDEAPVQIVDDAQLPRTRRSPNLFREFLLATLFGLAAGIAAAFLREYLDRSIKSPQELEDGIGVPIYAALPLFSSIKTRSVRKVKSTLVTIDHPTSVLAENYRTLRANIRFANLERPLKTLAITSSIQGEGKTVTTINLAVVLAQGGNRVIVVDSDLRRPSTHTHMGADLGPGFSDVLTGKSNWREVVRQTDVENLEFIFAGGKPGNPWALLDSPRFREMLEELKKEYEYILFDVPPVLAVADSAAFFPSLDGVFLLARYKGCSLDVVANARDQIERIGANLVGVIFNGFDARKALRRGYGAYGYYGSYRKYGYGYGGYGYGQGYGYGEEPRERGKAADAGKNRVAARTENKS